MVMKENHYFYLLNPTAVKWLTTVFCLLSFCLMGLAPLTNEVELTGRLKNKTGSSPADVGGLRVFVLGNHKIIAKGKSNAKGSFTCSGTTIRRSKLITSAVYWTMTPSPSEKSIILTARRRI